MRLLMVAALVGTGAAGGALTAPADARAGTPASARLSCGAFAGASAEPDGPAAATAATTATAGRQAHRIGVRLRLRHRVPVRLATRFSVRLTNPGPGTARTLVLQIRTQDGMDAANLYLERYVRSTRRWSRLPLPVQQQAQVSFAIRVPRGSSTQELRLTPMVEEGTFRVTARLGTGSNHSSVAARITHPGLALRRLPASVPANRWTPFTVRLTNRSGATYTGLTLAVQPDWLDDTWYGQPQVQRYVPGRGWRTVRLTTGCGGGMYGTLATGLRLRNGSARELLLRIKPPPPATSGRLGITVTLLKPGGLGGTTVASVWRAPQIETT